MGAYEGGKSYGFKDSHGNSTEALLAFNILYYDELTKRVQRSFDAAGIYICRYMYSENTIYF